MENDFCLPLYCVLWLPSNGAKQQLFGPYTSRSDAAQYREHHKFLLHMEYLIHRRGQHITEDGTVPSFGTWKIFELKQAN